MAKKKKGKDPAFMMYSGDFLVGTLTMTNEQVGKYVRLLCLHHQKGHLTEIDLKQYLVDTDLVLFDKFYKDSNGNYYNQKMQDVMTDRKEYTENRLKNFHKKDDKGNHISPHMGTHTGDEDEDEDIDETVIENQDKDKDVDGSVDVDTDKDYLDKASRQDMLANAMADTWDKITKNI
jgi:hypothetical protein